MPAVAVTREDRRRVRKVLLVDDHEMYLKYWTREFTRASVAVVTATSLETAVEAVEQEEPDLAIVDLFLTPPQTGIEVIKAIKTADSQIFCALVSAHMSVSHAVLGVRAGADDVFFKPFGAKQVIARVETGTAMPGSVPDPSVPTLDQIEWEHISRVLQDHGGNISQAAAALGVFRQSLQRKIAKHAPRVLVPDPSKKSK
jgi:two-component system response regulator RegA